MQRRAFLLSATIPCLAAAATPLRPGGRLREFELIAQPGEALTDTGRAPVRAWTYNGKVPGPEIRVRQGDRVRVTVLNRLDEPTTVHWHGIRLPNAMDGVPHLTQHPIEPGGRFVYEFDALDAGTFWYHSHFQSARQQDRGLQGTLIVEERETHPVHREVTWVLDDWRTTQAGHISEDFGHPFDMAHAGRIGNTLTVNGSVKDVFPVRAGERLRLRLVNTANARIFALNFEGHRPFVIALDGHPVAPHEPRGGVVVLAPGQRCDLLMECSAPPGSNRPVHDVFYPNGAYVLMDLVYSDSQALPPLPSFGLLPANPLSEPDMAGAQVHELKFEGGAMGRMHRGVLDGVELDLRELVRRGKAWAINGVVAGSHDMKPALTLARGRSYLFKLHNDTNFDHPIHLHGLAFRVVSRNGNPTPHREWADTVFIPRGQRAEIAFVADNPGDWMLHCHVLEHMEGGMMTVVRVA